ncbi:hypothetical protein ACFQZ4_37880 [Catellatospora coxensis]
MNVRGGECARCASPVLPPGFLAFPVPQAFIAVLLMRAAEHV